MPENRPQSGNFSRRQFLRHGIIVGASLTPALSLLSGCAHHESSAQSSTEPSAIDTTVAEYELNVSAQHAQPDGRDREIQCFNNTLPGLLIRAKLGQTLRIKVNNNLTVPTSVHWHGMHQPGTWQMDGVETVSREPIPPGSSFVYEFQATPAGTHWYHSHVGVQYGNGLIGPLIVDEGIPPAKYDREQILLINDWFLKPCEQILQDLLLNPSSTANGQMSEMKDAQSSGMGQMAMKPMGAKPDIADVPFESALFNGTGRFPGTQAPLAKVEIKAGETLRLRLINGSSTYQFRFQIDGHPLTIIAADGSPVVPVEVDNLQFGPGERYDALITANQSGSAWIRAATLGGDEARAILHYADAPDEPPPAGNVVWGARELTFDALRSPSPQTLNPNPRELVLRLGGTMRPYRWSVNDQFYPKSDPITAADGEWLRFVLVNPTAMDHPFHLHGHYFYVLGTPDHTNLTDPPLRDTVNIPAKNRLVILWKADNPGRWFFHCHIEWHIATGMGRVIEIS